MTENLFKELSHYFAENPVLSGEAVPYHEIADLERFAGFPLSTSYKEFVHQFGGGIVGDLSICGLRKAKAMSKRDGSAKEKTLHFRNQRWPGVNEWLIISSDLGGNPIGLDRVGHVYTFDHDFGGKRLIAESFELFLEQQLRK